MLKMSKNFNLSNLAKIMHRINILAFLSLQVCMFMNYSTNYSTPGTLEHSFDL